LLILLRKVCLIDAHSIDPRRREFSTPLKLQQGTMEALRNLERSAITADQLHGCTASQSIRKALNEAP
jgi:hypothetical protein